MPTGTSSDAPGELVITEPRHNADLAGLANTPSQAWIAADSHAQTEVIDYPGVDSGAAVSTAGATQYLSFNTPVNAALDDAGVPAYCGRVVYSDLHVGAGAQTEGVFVAVIPGDLVGQRFSGEEEHLFLAGKLGHGKPDVRKKSAGQNVDALARHQFIGDTNRIAGIRSIVARDHLELLAEHAALGIDLLDRHFPSLLVGIEKRGLRFVAIQLADLDGFLCRRCA